MVKYKLFTVQDVSKLMQNLLVQYHDVSSSKVICEHCKAEVSNKVEHIKARLARCLPSQHVLNTIHMITEGGDGLLTVTAQGSGTEVTESNENQLCINYKVIRSISQMPLGYGWMSSRAKTWNHTRLNSKVVLIKFLNHFTNWLT